MATRSTIALEYADGTVDMVYCHWDGYIEHNGRILKDHWSDPFKLQKLMDLGDLSSLGFDIGEQHGFGDDTSDCTFYGRDRGESDISARRFKDFDDYVTNAQFEEYNYILTQKEGWIVSDHDDGRDFITLDRAMEEVVL